MKTDVVYQQQKVTKAVITAAGKGTRQYPASLAFPKEMFPLVDRDGLTKPVIHIIAQEAFESGIEEICIVTQPSTEVIFKDYFQKLKQLGNVGDQSHQYADRIRYVHQLTADGFGHAVYQARDFADGDPILLMLGDHIFISKNSTSCARQAMDVFEHPPDESVVPEAVTAVQISPESELHLFGTIQGTPINTAGKIHFANLIIEKPPINIAREKLTTPGLREKHYLCHFGIHVFSSGIFDALQFLITNNQREKNEFQLTTAQELLRQNTGRYYTSTIDGQRCDMGIPSGLLLTQMALGKAGRFAGDLEIAMQMP